MAADPFATPQGPSDPFAPVAAAADPFATIPGAAPSTSPEAVAPEPTPGPFMMGVRQGLAGIKSSGGGLVAMAGRGFGVRSLEDTGNSIMDRANTESSANTMQVENMHGAGGVADFAKYSLGNLLPYALITTLLGSVGRGLGTVAGKGVASAATRSLIQNIGTVALPGAFNIGVEAGTIYPDAVKNTKDPITRSILGGIAAGSLDTAFPAYIAGRLGLFSDAEKVLSKGAFGVRGMLDAAGKEALKASAFEAGTEGAQTFIERLSAGQPLDGPDATSDYTNSMAVAGFGAPLAGAGAGAVHYRATHGAPVEAPAAAPVEPIAPAAPVSANPATPASNEAVAPAGVAAAGEAVAPLPTLFNNENIKSEFPEIEPGEKPAPASLYGRIEELKSSIDDSASKISSLQDEIASDKRPKGRTKQVIRAEITAAQNEHAQLTQRLSNLNTLASTPEYQSKTGSVDNGVLVPQSQSQAASPSIITPGASSIEKVEGEKPGFMKSATELVEEGKIKQRAAELEIPITNTPRETIKAPDLKAAQDQFLERASNVAQSSVQSLVDQGIVAPAAQRTTQTIIYKSVQSALTAGNVDDAKATIRNGIEKAVSRKLLKQDVDGFVDKVFAGLAGEQTQTGDQNATRSVRSDQGLDNGAGDEARSPGREQSENAGGSQDVSGQDIQRVAPAGNAPSDQQGAVVPAVPLQPAPASEVIAAPPVENPEQVAKTVDRPAVLVIGKVGRTPLSAEPLAIRANPVTGGYDLFQGGYNVQDFNTAENITFPKEMSTADIVKAVKANSKDLFGNRSRFYEDKGKAYNSQAAVDEHIREVVGSTQQVFSDRGRQVVEALGKILGNPDRLEVVTKPVAANEPAGRISLRPEKDTIAVAANAKDVLSVAYHEGFHYIESRVLESGERAVLTRGLAPGTKFFEQVLKRAKQYDYENKTNIADEIQAKPEEAHAYGFEMWKRGELQPKGALERVFQKIREAIERIGNMLNGSGFKSVLDIYKAIDAGEYAARNPIEGIAGTTELPSRAATAEVSLPRAVIDENGKIIDPRTAKMLAQLPADKVETAHSALDSLDAAHGLYANVAASGGEQVAKLRTAIENAEKALAPSRFRTTLTDRVEQGKNYGSPALAVTTELNRAIGDVRKTFRGQLTDTYFSHAALVDMAQQMANGELLPTQLTAETSKFLDGIDLPKPTFKQVFGIGRESITGSVKRWYLENIASGTFIARDSRGFGNVFAVLTGHKQRKDFLISQGVDDMLSKWDPRRGASQADMQTVGQALFKRTEGAFKVGSPEYQSLLSTLSSEQRVMFDQANAMISDRLQQEFNADKRTMASLLGADSPQYKEWEAARSTKVQQLIDEGYVPERRYGDHVVHVTVNIKDKEGNAKPLTLVREQFETEAEAKARLKQYQSVFEGDPAFQPQYEYKYAATHDGSLSYQQFLDMARRQGIELTQAERERLARAMVSSDSMRNNRIFRRSNVPGYSKDSYRVLAEFAVTMANKIAYNEFSDAINSAAAGNEVQVAVKLGQPSIAINRDTNLWAGDGPQAGFYRNLSDQRIDYVMNRDPGGNWSRNARAAASMYFLGGSISAGLVNLSSLPMNTVPYLYQHTGYANAFGKVLDAFRATAVDFSSLRDISKLKDLNIPIASVDAVPGLRQALIEAAQDGTVLDTEIYHIMGTTRGGMLAKSPRVQQAMNAWMAPFRMAEQTNRYTTFIASYKIGQENGLAGDALYKFAQESVYNTQFRYDEANRPGLAHNPVWAILFTFKSYPIFMGELITTLFRQNPRAGVAMLLSLAVASGINGLPFAEDLMDLVDTISQRLFKSPFNTKRAIRNTLKSASEAITGADLSGVFMNGLVNEMTGMSFASRVGLGQLIPGTRMFAADADFKQNVMQTVGPVASMVFGAGEGALDAVKGQPATQVLREATPLAVQNAVKAYQQFTQGYASDNSGRKLADTSTWESFAQALGFSSAKLNNAYDLDRIDRQTQAFYKEAQLDFSNNIVRAVRSGNAANVREAYQGVIAWNQAHPDMPMVLSGPGLRRQIAEAGMPINQRTLRMLPKPLRGGSVAFEIKGDQ